MSGEYWRRKFFQLTEASDVEGCPRCGVYVVVKDGKPEPHLYGVEDMQPCEAKPEETPSEEPQV